MRAHERFDLAERPAADVLSTEKLLEARMDEADLTRRLFDDEPLGLGIDRKYLAGGGGGFDVGEIEAL